MNELNVPFRLDLHSLFKHHLKKGISSKSMINISQSSISQSIRNISNALNQTKLFFNFGATSFVDKVAQNVSTIANDQEMINILVLVDRVSLNNAFIRQIIERFFGVYLKVDFDDDELCDKMIGNSVRLMMYDLGTKWKKIKYFCYDYVFVYNFETKINSYKNLVNLVPKIQKSNEGKMMKIFYSLLPKNKNFNEKKNERLSGSEFYNPIGTIDGLNVFIALKLFLHKIMHFTVTIDNTVKITYGDKVLADIKNENTKLLNSLEREIFKQLHSIDTDSNKTSEFDTKVLPDEIMSLYYNDNFLYSADLRGHEKNTKNNFISELKFYNFASLINELREIIANELNQSKNIYSSENNLDQKERIYCEEFIKIKSKMIRRCEHFIQTNSKFIELFKKRRMKAIITLLGLEKVVYLLRKLRSDLYRLIRQIDFNILEKDHESFESMKSTFQNLFSNLIQDDKNSSKYYIICSLEYIENIEIDSKKIQEESEKIKHLIEHAKRFSSLNLISKRSSHQFIKKDKALFKKHGEKRLKKSTIPDHQLEMHQLVNEILKDDGDGLSTNNSIERSNNPLFSSTFETQNDSSLVLVDKLRSNKFYSLKKTKKSLDTDRQKYQELFFNQSIRRKLEHLRSKH